MKKTIILTFALLTLSLCSHAIQSKENPKSDREVWVDIM